MNYVVDPNSSYIELSQSDTALDYLQFPIQTLKYRAGDCDDLSILYAALLESISVKTAFITIPGHIFMAFSLGLEPEEAKKVFQYHDDLIFIDNDSWVPVEITLVQEGFMAAWKEGAKEWRENESEGSAAFYPVREAWRLYQPTGIVESASDVLLPDMQSFLARYKLTMNVFIDQQIKEKVGDLQDLIANSNNDPRYINKLGVVYARYGLYEKAILEFERGAARNHMPSILNLGNLFFIRDQFDEALVQFNRAYAMDADNPTVLLCLSKVNFELENYGSSRNYYTKLEQSDPKLAARFDYLGSKDINTARAEDVSIRDSVVWEE
jgi:tetratricopeptide (TPR) repeat protein